MTPPIEHERRHASTEDSGNWSEWKNLVLSKLDGLETKVQSMQDSMVQLQIDQAGHKSRMSVIGGIVAVVATCIMQWIFSAIKLNTISTPTQVAPAPAPAPPVQPTQSWKR